MKLVFTEETLEETPSADLSGQRVVIFGKLCGMNQRDAGLLIRRFGGEVVTHGDPQATLLLVSDERVDAYDPSGASSSAISSSASSAALPGPAEVPEANRLPAVLRERILTGATKVVGETQLWTQLGWIDSDGANEGVRSLYTPAQLAPLLDVPIEAVRRWQRSGALLAVRCVHKLLYFDFCEVAVARRLASLWHAGCTLVAIDRQVAQLVRAMPEVKRPLADPDAVVVGRQLLIRRGARLSDACGQFQFDFDPPFVEEPEQADEEPESQALLSMAAHRAKSGAALGTSSTTPEQPEADSDDSSAPDTEAAELARQLLQQARDFADAGDLDHATELYRTLLVATGPTAQAHFELADVLSRQGDAAAARERYYMAIELDEQFVEARLNLGCILAETGELELAAAAFQGTLACHADYADAHYHLANVLDRLDRREEAQAHRQHFLALAPESPWASAARDLLPV